MRPDHSDIHPLKRLTRIAAGCMFGSSLSMTFALQIVSFGAKAGTIRANLTFTADSDGVVLERRIPYSAFNSTVFYYGFFPREISPGQERVTSWNTFRDTHGFTSFCSVPGLTLYTHDPRMRHGWAVTIHHVWLIGASAVLYLATHARSRRSDRRQSGIRSGVPPPQA